MLTCAIPDAVLRQAAPVWAYVYVDNGESGQTVKAVRICITPRAEPSEAVTPEQVDAYGELVAQLNGLIAEVEQTNNEAMAQADRAEDEADRAEGEADDAELAKITAQRAFADLLAMLGSDIATLTDGKLTPSQIPALSINDVLPITSADELTELTAQRGDCALVIAGDIVTDSYILAADDPTIAENWKKLGVSYVANAGHAATADTAANADMVNGHRVVRFASIAEMEAAVKVSGTLYYAPYDEE